jgi:hypothetical protein
LVIVPLPSGEVGTGGKRPTRFFRCGLGKGVGLDPVDGEPFPVQLEHRDPLAVAPLELRVARDVDLLGLVAERGEILARPLAEVAVPGDVEREAYG